MKIEINNGIGKILNAFGTSRKYVKALVDLS